MPSGGARETILVITGDPLVPVSAGGAARLFRMIAFLRESGFRIELLTPYYGRSASRELHTYVDALHVCGGPIPVLRYWSKKLVPPGMVRRMLSALAKQLRGARYRTGLANGAALPLVIRKIDRRLCDAAKPLLERLRPRAVIGIYAWTAMALESAPAGTLKIIDTIDIQHLRRARAQKAGSDLPEHDCTREEEVRELSRADVLLAIQRHEEKQLRNMCPGKRVILVEHAEDTRTLLASPVDSKTVLFVGSQYDPNVQGIRRFMETAWPRIRTAVPDAELVICGTVCNGIKDVPQGVKKLGRVPTLEPYYRQAAVVINPVPYGSGMKIKSVEALAFGKCLVTTLPGITGLEDEPGAPFLASEIEEMAGPIVGLLRDPVLRAKKEQETHRYARERFSEQRVYRELERVLREGTGAD